MPIAPATPIAGSAPRCSWPQLQQLSPADVRAVPESPTVPALVVDRLRAGHGRMAEAAPGEDRLAPAELGDLGGLVLARLRIGGLRIDDLAQGGLAVGNEPAMSGVPAEVARLVGIGLEV